MSTSQSPLAGGNNATNGDKARFGVVTVSDRASAGTYEDLSGPAILKFFDEAISSSWEAVYRIIPDEKAQIEKELKTLCDVEGCCLVVTTGGTGPAPRDVTPEATEAVCDRLMPGYGEQMRAISLRHVPTAVLSRQTAGLRGKSLILNLPGKPKAIRETIDEVFASIPYCIELMEGPYITTNEHVVKAFRPGKKKIRASPSLANGGPTNGQRLCTSQLHVRRQGHVLTLVSESGHRQAARRAANALRRTVACAEVDSRFLQTSVALQQEAAPAPSDHIEVEVNGQPVQILKGSTVMAACDAAGVDIPRFCYHHRLSIAGNCRMCLVEVAKSPKPVASCAMPAAPGMKIKTDSALVKKAREGVMEFLLINHPLDCPICDQGGECDLQDQSMHFGSDRGRFTEMKRAVKDKNLGPLVKTVMTRCIHCTRCVRFASEVAGVQDLGMTGRGNNSEIGTYVEKLMTSELSGNVIDLCPVGALTSKPAAFTARNWELRSVESVDTSDAMGCNIRVDSRGNEVMRILPRLNEDVNEEWISDKARFQYDGLKRQRLDVPLVNRGQGLERAHWADALTAVQAGLKGIKGNEMRAIAGKLADAESIIALKDLMNRLGCSNLYSDAGFADLDADVRSNYLMNTSLSGISQADVVLLVGSNPRTEAPVLNARLRKLWLEGGQLATIGPDLDLTYPHEHLGEGAPALAELLKTGSGWGKKLKEAKNPVIIVGPGILHRQDRGSILQKVHEVVEKTGVVRDNWNGYNVMHDSASRVAALDLGFLPSARSASAPPPKFVYLLGSDDFAEEDVPADAFVVYQGHHGDRGAARANVVLPGTAYTEKAATYVNFEGRAQRTKVAVPPLGDAREDWTIVRALSEVLDLPLPYDSRADVRARLGDVAPHLTRVGEWDAPLWLNGQYFKAFAARAAGDKAAPSQDPFQSSIENFYLTDVISRSSQTMAKCVQAREVMPTSFNTSQPGPAPSYGVNKGGAK
ncbi:hypothetical protein WJX73_009161 [Symbiochloris irregularis]|uniref:molybdopterin molybdotransferase n=1 Tax=Symbiochloris irregularis TaxID=706552 RepID=A0AAW1NKT3_9CHLO